MKYPVLKRLCKIASLVISGALLVTVDSRASSNQPPPPGAEPQAAAVQTPAPSLLAKFDGTVDTKSVKSGAVVIARSMKELKLADLDIPKGSKVLGTVTSVKSMRDGNGDSMLGVRFDRVEMKDNRVMRIQGLIVAIGPAPTSETGLGYNSVLNRGGAGSTPELDPSIAADKYDKDKPELATGSTLEGIALAVHFDPDGATLIRGVHRDIKLNSDVMVRVALYRRK